MVVSNIFYFHPYLGKIPILTNTFQMGSNHQLEKHIFRSYIFIKGSLDEKLPSYEVLKMRENRCLENRCLENRCLENRCLENRCLENRCFNALKNRCLVNRCLENRCLGNRCLENRCLEKMLRE